MHSKLLWTQTLDINPGKVSLQAYFLPDARGFWPVATVGGAQELKCLNYAISYTIMKRDLQHYFTRLSVLMLHALKRLFPISLTSPPCFFNCGIFRGLLWEFRDLTGYFTDRYP